MRYRLPTEMHYVDGQNLSRMPSDIQVEVMREWFSSRYVDPVHECPYDSEEGGYIYLWGGPYDAAEEIEGEFGQYVDEAVIRGLIKELEADCHEWSAVRDDDPDPDEDFLAAIGSDLDHVAELASSLSAIEQLSGVQVSDELRPFHRRSLYVSAITAMETFLSDFFVQKVMSDEAAFESFVATFKPFEKRLIKTSDILSERQSLKQTCKKFLADLLWHDLPKVTSIYKDTFRFDAPNLGKIIPMVMCRHDLVHRGGKTKDGEQITIDEQDLADLLAEIRALASAFQDGSRPSF